MSQYNHSSYLKRTGEPCKRWFAQHFSGSFDLSANGLWVPQYVVLQSRPLLPAACAAISQMIRKARATLDKQGPEIDLQNAQR